MDGYEEWKSFKTIVYVRFGSFLNGQGHQTIIDHCFFCFSGIDFHETIIDHLFFGFSGFLADSWARPSSGPRVCQKTRKSTKTCSTMVSWNSRPEKQEKQMFYNGLVTVAIQKASKRYVYNGFEACSPFITIQTITYVRFGDFLSIQI